MSLSRWGLKFVEVVDLLKTSVLYKRLDPRGRRLLKYLGTEDFEFFQSVSHWGLYSTKAIEVVLQDLKSPLVQTAIRNFCDVQQNYAAGRHD
jgi:hypothetical protein